MKCSPGRLLLIKKGLRIYAKNKKERMSLPAQTIFWAGVSFQTFLVIDNPRS